MCIRDSPGTEHSKLLSMGIGPNLSESENHLHMISEVRLRSKSKLSLLPEDVGKRLF